MEAVEALALVAGHVDEELLLRNEYLAAENEILRSKIHGRVPMTDDERIRLAKLGKRIGLKALKSVSTIVAPETIMAWYRRLVAKKYAGSRNRGPGRPPIDPRVEKLVVRMALENPGWGYDRIVGALSNLGHTVCDETVARVLRRHGIPPAGGRKPKISWADFIAAHQDVIVAADFFTIEVFTPAGLACFYVPLFPSGEPAGGDPVECRERLGGLLKFYHRAVA